MSNEKQQPEKSLRERYADRFKILDKTFIWTSEDGETVAIPLRVSMAVFMKFDHRALDRGAFFDLMAEIAPEQLDVIKRMDGAHDFDPMVFTWNEVYGSPGESGASST